MERDGEISVKDTSKHSINVYLEDLEREKLA